MRWSRARRRWAAVPALATCLALAGCGSQVDAATVAAVNDYQYAAGDRVVAGDPSVPGSGPDLAGATGPGAGGAELPTSTSGDGPDGGPGGTSGPGGGQEDDGTGQQSPTGTVKAADCAGFQNGTGITDDTITIGNASDVSGPVPGLFEESQLAVKAYVAWFNATGSTICGRKLELASYDSRTDAGADQQAYSRGCTETFAMVGSMSGFDSGGAGVAEECGLPDVRAIATTPERTACTTCYAAQPAGPEEFENAVPDFIMRNYDGGQKAAMLFLNGGAAGVNGPAQVKFSEKRGMKYVYVQGIDLAEFNYAPYVQEMQERGVETVQFVGANPQFVRLAQAMQQQGFKPKLYLLDPTAYSPSYTESAGDAAKGTVVYLNFTPFEEADRNPELRLYLDYLQQVSPGATPGFFGVYAWSAARLFVEQATRLGGKLDRKSLIASMSGVEEWTANGLHSRQRVAAKRISECWRFIEWTGSVWKPLEGTAYQCRGTTTD